MLGRLLCLSVRPLQAIAVILSAVRRHMESLALELLRTHVLSVASDELGAACAFQLRLLAPMLHFFVSGGA